MKNTESLWLAIDQGTQSSRAAVINGQGELVEICQVPVSLNRISDSNIEQDGTEIVESVWQAIRQVLSAVDASRIVAAGMATQRSSVIAWDRRSGKPLSKVISWQDVRGREFVESHDNTTRTDIQQRSGLPVSPHYGASKIRWLLSDLRAAKSTQIDEADICIGPLASFLLFHLVDDKTICQVDHANGGRMQLMNFERREWDDDLLALFEVPKSILPVCRPTHFEFGNLTGTKIPVRVCQGDQTAAVFGYGKLPTGNAHVNLGTGGFILSPVHNLERIREQKQLPLLISLADSSENKAEYFLEGTVNGAGSAIKWAAKQLELESVETKLDAWAEAVDHPPLFFNSVGGVGSPIWNASPSAALANRWFNQNLEPIALEDLPAEEAMTGVLESVVFLVAMNIDAMRKLGVETSTLRLSGGVTASRSLCQKLADLTVAKSFVPMRPNQRCWESLACCRFLQAKMSDRANRANRANRISKQIQSMIQHPSLVQTLSFSIAISCFNGSCRRDPFSLP